MERETSVGLPPYRLDFGVPTLLSNAASIKPLRLVAGATELEPQKSVYSEKRFWREPPEHCASNVSGSGADSVVHGCDPRLAWRVLVASDLPSPAVTKYA